VSRPALTLVAVLGLAIIVGCGGDDEATTSTGSAVAVPAGEVIRGHPYMGIACPYPAPDALACDRVGLSVRLTEPAHRVTATLGGRRFALDDPAYSGRLRNGESSRFAGYLHPAGLREPGPLHVLGHRRPGRDRWLDSAPSRFPVTLTLERKDGAMQMTKIDVWLAPGWG
jgi:hypothetical protein